jgi:hypothetical protein
VARLAQDSVIADNRAGDYGAGVYIASCDQATFANVAFTNNSGAY